VQKMNEAKRKMLIEELKANFGLTQKQAQKELENQIKNGYWEE